MKKVLILVILMVMPFVTFAQGDFNKFSIGIETGMHSVSDQSAIVTDNYNHFGADVRYNINELFGVGIRGGYDNINVNTIQGNPVNLDYGRINLEATISVFELLRLRHKYINLLVHGGPGVAFIRTDNGYSENPMNVAGGITALVKLSRSLAFKVDYTSSIHLSQDRTLDGFTDITNAGINSVVDNLSAGLVFYIGKKDKNGNKRQHADWYVTPTVEPVVPVINNITQVTEVREIIKTEVAKKEFREFVFFNHDEYDITNESDYVKPSQNAIYKAKSFLIENPESKLVITSYASATKSTSEYNQTLSQKRGDDVKNKLVSMGISSDRIRVVANGKDLNYSNELVHDMARRVELTIE